MSEKQSKIQKATTTPRKGRGGARPGAGRKLGSTALITAATLLETIQNQSGRSFGDLLTEGYLKTVSNNNDKLRLEYERMIISKVVSDKVAVEVKDSDDTVAAKSAAFAAALATLQKRSQQSDNS
jgi:hypothetical protein